MPPIPSLAQTLPARLNVLAEANKNIQQLIQRLAKLDFQPGSLPLDSEDGDVRLELSAEIHDTLKGLEEELELVRQEAGEFVGDQNHAKKRRDSSKEAERSRIAVLVARLVEDLRTSRSHFRKAQLTAKHNADRARAKERELLFSNLQLGGDSTPSSITRRRTANPQLSESEIVAQASTDVTAALRRTHELMQSELSRSRFAQETLEQSTAALEDLGEKYTDLTTLLANSRALVTTLLKSQKSDTWYLETTFYILITTVIWLVFRRWFYGPISWFILWPLKIVFKILFAVVPVAGVGKSSTTSVTTEVSPSTSLIVQPSATGGIPRNPEGQQRVNYVPVGRGGGPHRHDPSPPGSLSQSVGKMTEEAQKQQESAVPQQDETGQHQHVDEQPDHPQFRQQQQAQQHQGEGAGNEAPIVRGDGTVLVESDRPRNPKKKMWEEDVETKKFEEKQAAVKRDEL